MKITKNNILEYLETKTQEFDIENLDVFTTNTIADNLFISRSIASQYLNELVNEKAIFKVKTRPVYYFAKEVLEKKYGVCLNDIDFVNLDDFFDYLREHGHSNSIFDILIGFDGSLQRLILQSTEIFDYPPNGLALAIYGQEGTGRKTLADLVCRNSLLNNGIVKQDSVIYRLELNENDNSIVKNLENIVKANNQKQVIIILSHFDKLNYQIEQFLIETFENKKYINIHFIFISNQIPKSFISSRLAKYIPLYVQMHPFDERPKEERESIIMSLFAKEEEALGSKFLLSSNVLRTLSQGKYEDNIQELLSIVKLTCAQAKLSASDKVIKIHTYDLPTDIIEKIEVSSEDLVYLSTEHYVPGKEIDIYFDFMNTVLDLFYQNYSASELNEAYKRIYNVIEEHLILGKDSKNINQGMELTLSNLISSVVSKRYLNLPKNVISVLSKIIYVYHSNAKRFNKWENENHDKINSAINKMQQDFVSDMFIIDDFKTVIESSVEMEITDILRIICCLTLHDFNRDNSKRKVMGMIICHGYSTASSIASATNTLIGSYVFDAIDMPLNTTVNEIQATVQERLRHVNRFADVVVMVDMGSLEAIASEIVLLSSRNVVLINNVSTKTALAIGYRIKNGDSIENIVSLSNEEFKTEYKIIHGRKKDTILFISESGLQTAKRMADLFRDSLPEDIPVNLQIGSFEKVVSGGIADYIETYNLLFTIGTENPGVDGITFIPLEDLITTGCINIISQKLSSYLTSDKVEQMIINIRRNFTLLNVVNYLTILNPQPLLDYVTIAVDNLQKRLGIELEGSRLISMYIHLCVLVERVVTKSGIIQNDSATDEFINNHSDFIKSVKESFRDVTAYYHIDIPNTEMKYIYSFIGVVRNGEI